MRSRVKRESPFILHMFVILAPLRDMRDLCDICAMSTTADTGRWVPDGHTFAARLALIRQRMVWNIKEAARACSLSDSSWREWELSGRLPRDYENVCKQIADIAGCDLYWLMTGSPTAPPPPPTHPVRRPERKPVHRRLRTVDADDGAVHVDDDALAYLKLATEELPRVDSNHQPFGDWPDESVEVEDDMAA